MSYQRSKAPLSLMEQLIMVFVFAFAAAICLQAFVYSDQLSKSGTAKETAAMRATEVIEVCKSGHGDLQQAATQLGGTFTAATDGSGDSIEKVYDEDKVRVVIKALAPESIGATEMYQKAEVSVYETASDGKEADKNPIYTVNAAWQLSKQTVK